MSIISIKFLIFMLALLVTYYIVPRKYRWVILLLASGLFYYLSSGKLIIFITLSIISIFILGIWLDKINNRINVLDKKDTVLKKKYLKRKKLIILLGVILNIMFIVFTKYYNFTITNVNYLLSIFSIQISKSSLLLPLGISYYTLEAISYIVDVYRGKYPASKNIFKVALYLLYFPKIIEGPISRFNELSMEFYENNRLDFNKIQIGCDLIILGLFKKMVIADRAAIYVNNIFGTNNGGITVILAMILYTIQIYAEFGGCIDIVRGVSYTLGIKLPSNFKGPFFAKDIQEFWRRWHISLGAWIKEYVFYPISLSKLNMKVMMFSKKHFNEYFYKFVSAAFPLLFVWLVNGIWHGASFKYIIYGMYYYILMMIGLLLAPLFNMLHDKLKINRYVLDIIHIIRTLVIVVIGMTLFRASSIEEFGNLIRNVFISGNGILEFGLTKIDFWIIGISVVFIFLIDILQEFKKIDLDSGFTNSVIIRSIFYTLLLCTIVILGIYGEGYDASNFIYGAF